MKRSQKQGELLREIRVRAKLTQDSMGEMLGVHKQFVSNIERGLCPIPARMVTILSSNFRVPKKRFVDTFTEDAKHEYRRGM